MAYPLFKAWMLENHITNEMLGKLLGITPGSVSQKLSGETGIPYQRMYKRMQDTDMFRVWELRAISEAANLSDEDIVKLVRGNV